MDILSPPCIVSMAFNIVVLAKRNMKWLQLVQFLSTTTKDHITTILHSPDRFGSSLTAQISWGNSQNVKSVLLWWIFALTSEKVQFGTEQDQSTKYLTYTNA